MYLVVGSGHRWEWRYEVEGVGFETAWRSREAGRRGEEARFLSLAAPRHVAANLY